MKCVRMQEQSDQPDGALVFHMPSPDYADGMK